MSQATLKSAEYLALRLDPQEQLMLMERLARNLREMQPASMPQDLYGVWRGQFPENFDLDSALRQVRSEWQSEGEA